MYRKRLCYFYGIAFSSLIRLKKMCIRDRYYPSANLTYGGYNILVSFAEDGTVQVASDIYDAGAKVASTYVLKQVLVRY